MIFYKANQIAGKHHLTANHIIIDFYNQGRNTEMETFQVSLTRHCMQYGSHAQFTNEDWEEIYDAQKEYLNEMTNTYHIISLGRKWWIGQTFKDAFAESGLKLTNEYKVTTVTTKLPMNQVVFQNGTVGFISRLIAERNETSKLTIRTTRKKRTKTRDQLIDELAKINKSLELLN